MLINAINNPELDISKKRKMQFGQSSAHNNNDIDASRFLMADDNDSVAANNKNDMWKVYLDKKLEMQREKMKREDARHKDNMNFQKMTLMLQEKMEKNRMEAINNLTNAINRMVDSKNNQ